MCSFLTLGTSMLTLDWLSLRTRFFAFFRRAKIVVRGILLREHQRKAGQRKLAVLHHHHQA